MGGEGEQKWILSRFRLLLSRYRGIAVSPRITYRLHSWSALHSVDNVPGENKNHVLVCLVSIRYIMDCDLVSPRAARATIDVSDSSSFL